MGISERERKALSMLKTNTLLDIDHYVTMLKTAASLEDFVDTLSSLEEAVMILNDDAQGRLDELLDEEKD